MFTTPEQLVELNKSTVDTALQLAHVSFDNFERLVNLNLAASKEAFAEAARNFKALAEVKDPQDLIALRTKISESGVERGIGFSRSVYELATHAQSQVSQLVESRLGEINRSVIAAVDKAVKSAPAGADVAVAAIKSSVTATAAAIDGITKAAKQVVELTDAGVKATANATSAAAKAAKVK